MSFLSLAFLVFLPTFFLAYWALRNKSVRIQNTLLVAANFIFYFSVGWRYAIILALNITIGYAIGYLMETSESDRKRRLLMLVALLFNFGVLGYLKYYGFFISSFVDFAQALGFSIDIKLMQVAIPIGLSFYTFMSTGYVLDVYWRKIKPTTDFIAFAAYISYFPQISAGPIGRAQTMLPQFLTRRYFDLDKARDGIRQFLWGLFKKVVIADQLGGYTNALFSNYTTYSGAELFLGAIYYAIQIYADFSGYSDMAIGLSRLFGIELMDNFSYPYFSRDIAEFWRKWHISLMTWLREYIFYPLGGGLGSRTKAIRNTLVIFVISGLWHGANWGFIVWGLLNGVFFLPLVLGYQKTHMKKIAYKRIFPSVKELLQILSTFILVSFTWIFFRADSVSHAVQYLYRMMSSSWIDNPSYKMGVPLIVFLLVVEWIQRNKRHPLQIETLPVTLRWSIYFALTFTTIFFMGNNQTAFIYNQF